MREAAGGSSQFKQVAKGRSANSAGLRVLAAVAVAVCVTAVALGPGHPVMAVGEPAGSLRSVAATETSGSVVPSGGVVPTSSAIPTASAVATTGTFARMAGSKLDIHFPAGPKKLVAVGFHQADNRKAVRFVPQLKCYGRGKAAKTKALIKKGRFKLFQQPLRGRGSSNFSAADCAMPRKTTVVAPVSGIVTNVRSYKLCGYVSDLRLEIKPDAAPRLRVVMIHITGVKVKRGQRVVGGVTPVAVVRRLPFVSTINRFVPVKPVDHVHIQVNKDTFKGSY